MVDRILYYFKDFVENMLTDYPELEDTCRDVFRDIIYSTRDTDDKEQDPKGAEFEVIMVEDLKAKIDE